jgi:hypothetical protein
MHVSYERVAYGQNPCHVKNTRAGVNSIAAGGCARYPLPDTRGSMTIRLTCIAACAALGLLDNAPAAPAPAPATEKQKELLAQILRTLPRSEPWEEWLKKTGAHPPDFDKLPSVPFLPDPLRFASGRQANWSDWPKRREELLALFQHYVTGSWPVSPTNLNVADFRERNEGASLVVRPAPRSSGSNLSSPTRSRRCPSSSRKTRIAVGRWSR